jgi:sterol desaturase/sphingolipid hydroxylase (fatty acid hydroxylase superfamily)
MPTPIEVLLDPISLGLLSLYGVLIIIELLIPARKLPKNKGWHLRAAMIFTLYFFLSTYLPLFWDQYLTDYQIFDFEQVNPLVGTVTALLVFELLIYVWHRTMHTTNWLWRSFHQMHHSAERLESFGAFYFSPLDMVGFTMIGSLALTVVAGLPPQAVTWFLFITMFLGIFQHTNINTPRWLGYIVQRPESHTVHHKKGVHAYNYSDLPLFDILFGTFKNPKSYEGEIGFYHGASNKIGQMLIFRDIATNKKTQD